MPKLTIRALYYRQSEQPLLYKKLFYKKTWTTLLLEIVFTIFITEIISFKSIGGFYFNCQDMISTIDIIFTIPFV